VDKPFAVVTYTEAVDLLLKADREFEYPVNWGSDLQSEHERYLTEHVFSGTPLFVTDYPKGIKASPMPARNQIKSFPVHSSTYPRNLFRQILAHVGQQSDDVLHCQSHVPFLDDFRV
jgi:asparaginyl-tRNA synthetase